MNTISAVLYSTSPSVLAGVAVIVYLIFPTSSKRLQT
jgi:hypothetical protein